MLNIEKYKDQILESMSNGYGICDAALKYRCDESCEDVYIDFCRTCRTETFKWLCDEYEEPEVDWSKVPRGTMVEVRDDDDEEWKLRKFYCYDSDFTYPYLAYHVDGTAVSMWRYCRLAERKE